MTKTLPNFPFKGYRTYRAGEMVEYTGTHTVDGGYILFDIVVVDDSHRIGKTLVTYTVPEAR